MDCLVILQLLAHWLWTEIVFCQLCHPHYNVIDVKSEDNSYMKQMKWLHITKGLGMMYSFSGHIIHLKLLFGGRWKGEQSRHGCILNAMMLIHIANKPSCISTEIILNHGLQYMVILFLVFLLQFSLACACLAVNGDQKDALAEQGWKMSSNKTRSEVQYQFECCGFSQHNLPENDILGHPPCSNVSVPHNFNML